ncbi:uncharacterized protein LOC120277584 [Dioscorea cayenensis subsp. rotundata]|uniref:Uncharacterized protein LOC120277584 n=1 Tax=Dioscorea cayennensis subsp. rotundata TaxID=55577 RepID=A0AB40CK76_DIOCR|nr:uncharacterized protein LOC120277584 [Dioscorea cayenensis subsp. rotundata]
MNTYKNILNPTHDKDSWPKSDQGPVIPLNDEPKKREIEMLRASKHMERQAKGESITADDQAQWYVENDALRLIDENERAEANTEAGGEYHITPPALDHQVSQFITIPVQAIHEATPLVEYSMRQQQHESGLPVTRVPTIPNQKAHVELPSLEKPR